MLEYKNLCIIKYLHDGFRIDFPLDSQNIKSIYIDPFKLPDEQPPADYIFISHEHFDHLDIESIKKVLKSETVVVGNQQVLQGLKEYDIENFKLVMAGNEVDLGDFIVSCKPAYNINKFRSENEVYHPKNKGGLGFHLEFTGLNDGENVYVFHMGDTDFIEEHEEAMKVDILLVPISGKYVMTPQEAADATNQIKPNLAVPMHHDAGIAGSIEHADIFIELCESDVVVMEPLK